MKKLAIGNGLRLELVSGDTDEVIGGSRTSAGESEQQRRELQEDDIDD